MILVCSASVGWACGGRRCWIRAQTLRRSHHSSSLQHAIRCHHLVPSPTWPRVNLTLETWPVLAACLEAGVDLLAGDAAESGRRWGCRAPLLSSDLGGCAVGDAAGSVHSWTHTVD